ncbi:methyltransferase domain-containing protein [Candidatus Woesearchaeota archaeon]|nr:methyltransferase domain-containing protein [Candidatus Woesearchaeota archaeon]
MKELFTLGNLYVSDFLKEGEQPRGGRSELKLVLDEDLGAVRLEKPAPPQDMYGKYWYRSGTNATMTNELKSIAENIIGLMKLNKGDLWLDIACNDGTMFRFIPKDIVKIGIDPADDSFVAESSKLGDEIIQDYFSKKTYQKAKKTKNGTLKAKVVTCIAMFYDLDKPDPFVRDVYDIMDDNGLWVMQLSYTSLMIKQLAFDNICHEHIYYYSLFNLKKLLERNGFKIMDCQLNDVNGGSFRVYIMKDVADKRKFSTAPHRDVCEMRVESILKYEETLKLDKPGIWLDFFKRIEALKKQTVDFIKNEKSKGKSIWGYGASTKGNTLLQYFGLDSKLITGIAERSPYKFGLRTVGTNIPIYSEDEMRKAKPDYLLVLPWHFINEFMSREKAFLEAGGKFIVPCPKFEIIGK